VLVHGVDHGHGIVPVHERGHDHGRDHGHGHGHGDGGGDGHVTGLIVRS
jgi:nickel/cobalt exporter